MKRFQVVKCNPNIYRNLLLKFGQISAKPFVYSVSPADFTKRDSLVLVYQAASNSVRVVNKMLRNSTSVGISLNEFDAVLLKFIPAIKSAVKHQLIWNIKVGLNYTINLEINAKFNSMNTIRRNSPASIPPTSTIKPYWQKRSDFVRSKFSRNSRYVDIMTVTASDTRLIRSYAVKDSAIKFLSWKTKGVNAVACQSVRLENSLVNWLTVLEFYSTYSAAVRAVAGRFVLVNESVVTDPFYAIQIGDVLRVLPCKWNSEIDRVVPINCLIPFIAVNYLTHSAVVFRYLNQSYFQNGLYSQLNIAHVPVNFGNPLNAIFMTGRWMITRWFK